MRHLRIITISAETLEPFRFLFLPTCRLFSHLVPFVINSHCFPFVGPNTNTVLNLILRINSTAKVFISFHNGDLVEFRKNAS